MGLVIELTYADHPDNKDVKRMERGHPHDCERKRKDGSIERIEIKTSAPLKGGKIRDILKGLPQGVLGPPEDLTQALLDALSIGPGNATKYALLFEVSYVVWFFLKF